MKGGRAILSKAEVPYFCFHCENGVSAIQTNAYYPTRNFGTAGMSVRVVASGRLGWYFAAFEFYLVNRFSNGLTACDAHTEFGSFPTSTRRRHGRVFNKRAFYRRRLVISRRVAAAAAQGHGRTLKPISGRVRTYLSTWLWPCITRVCIIRRKTAEFSKSPFCGVPCEFSKIRFFSC